MGGSRRCGLRETLLIPSIMQTEREARRSEREGGELSKVMKRGEKGAEGPESKSNLEKCPLRGLWLGLQGIQCVDVLFSFTMRCARAGLESASFI